MRLVDAVGKDVWKYELLPHVLNADTVDPTGFTSTVVEAGAGGTTEFSANNSAGRVGTITTDNADNDGGSYQLFGENLQCSSDNELYLGCEFQINDVDATDLFFGAAITDTALLGGVTDAIYIESVDGSDSVSVVSEKDSTETQTDSAGTLVDATDQIWEIYWDGTSAYYFIDGSEVAIHTTNIPDNEALRLSIEFLTGETTANTCDIKWMRAIQIGR